MTDLQTADLILCPQWLVPVEPSGVVLESHACVINDGKIIAVLPQTEVSDRFACDQIVRLDGQVLLPGLVNAHTHAAMVLMRGLADDLPLMQWLTEHIWPAEGHFAAPDFVKAGTSLALAEMIRGGTTCFADMYYFPDEVAHTVRQAGLRACLGLIVIEAPTPWAASAAECLSKATDVHQQWRDESLITAALAPHAPYTVSDDSFERIRVLADELDIIVHTHLHETQGEVEDSLAEFSLRPMARMQKVGIANSSLMAAHMTQLTSSEVELCAQRNISVVHCPESNLKLASGICPVDTLLKAGVTVALGTDGAASNNDLDMFAEMRTAALLGKVAAEDPTAVSAAAALEMATLSGAKALRLDHLIGSITPGKQADLISVDLRDLESTPVFDVVSQLVYATGRHQVQNVWVNGRQLLAGRNLQTLDEADVAREGRRWGRRISDWRENSA